MDKWEMPDSGLDEVRPGFILFALDFGSLNTDLGEVIKTRIKPN